MGKQACGEMAEMLEHNKILTMLNIADNAIGNEGLKMISDRGLTKDSQMVMLNLSNNDLNGPQCIESLSDIISGSKCLVELNLSDNKLGELGIEALAHIFTNNASRL